MCGKCYSWKKYFHYTDGSNLVEEILFLKFLNLTKARFETIYCSIGIMTVNLLGLGEKGLKTHHALLWLYITILHYTIQ